MENAGKLASGYGRFSSFYCFSDNTDLNNNYKKYTSVTLKNTTLAGVIILSILLLTMITMIILVVMMMMITLMMKV